jgi:hypothetical protein
MGAVSGDDPRQLVRRGYDALSYRYRADDAEDGNYGPWLAALRTRIPAGAAVLDLGCGNGIPVARHLAAAGYAVTGVDISQVQIQRPAAGPGRDLIAGWLRPGGWLLATTGHQAWTGVEDGWLGGTVPMWWSHADAATYRVWLEAAGLQVTAQDFVPEGDGGHTLFWARRPAPVSLQTRSRSGRPAHRTG